MKHTERSSTSDYIQTTCRRFSLALIVMSVSFVACGTKSSGPTTGSLQTTDTIDHSLVNAETQDAAQPVNKNVNANGRAYTGYSESNLSTELQASLGTTYQPQPFVKNIDQVTVTPAQPTAPVRTLDVAIQSKSGAIVHYQGVMDTTTSSAGSAELKPQGDLPADMKDTVIESECITDDCTETENKITNTTTNVIVGAFATANEERGFEIWKAGDPSHIMTGTAQVQSSEVVDGPARFQLAMNTPKAPPADGSTQFPELNNLKIRGELVETAGDCVKLAGTTQSGDIKACMLGNSGDGADIPIALIVPPSINETLPSETPVALKVSPVDVNTHEVRLADTTSLAAPVNAPEPEPKGTVYYMSLKPRPQSKPVLHTPPQPVVTAPTPNAPNSSGGSTPGPNAPPAAPVAPAPTQDSRAKVSSAKNSGAHDSNIKPQPAPAAPSVPPQHAAAPSVTAHVAKSSPVDILDDAELPLVCRKDNRERVKDILISQVLEGCRRRAVVDFAKNYWMKGDASDIREILSMTLGENHRGPGADGKMKAVAEDLPAFQSSVKALTGIHMSPLLLTMPFSESRFFNKHPTGSNASAGRWQLMPVFAKAHNLPLEERYDAIATAKTVGEYMKTLMKRPGREGRFEFALASYNCGEGCMNRQVERYAHDTDLDYWEMLRRGMFKHNAAAEYSTRILSAAVIWLAPQEFNLTSPTSGKAIPAFDLNSIITSLDN